MADMAFHSEAIERLCFACGNIIMKNAHLIEPSLFQSNHQYTRTCKKEHCNNATTTKFKNSEEENRTMKMKIEDLQKRNEVLRKLIKDQETTIAMEKQNAKRRDSQSEHRSDALKESHSTTTEKYIYETVDKLLDRKLETVAEIHGKSILAS